MSAENVGVKQKLVRLTEMDRSVCLFNSHEFLFYADVFCQHGTAPLSLSWFRPGAVFLKCVIIIACEKIILSASKNLS